LQNKFLTHEDWKWTWRVYPTTIRSLQNKFLTHEDWKVYSQHSSISISGACKTSSSLTRIESWEGEVNRVPHIACKTSSSLTRIESEIPHSRGSSHMGLAKQVPHSRGLKVTETRDIVVDRWKLAKQVPHSRGLKVWGGLWGEHTRPDLAKQVPHSRGLKVRFPNSFQDRLKTCKTSSSLTRIESLNKRGVVSYPCIACKTSSSLTRIESS